MPLSFGKYYEQGGTDVTVTDGGTNASDAPTARTNLGVDIYDATTWDSRFNSVHPGTDHSGVTGVPEAYYQVLDNSATMSDINTAINTAGIQVVYLRPGQYNFTSFTQISVPTGKALVGLGNHVTLSASPTSSAVLFSMNVTFASNVIDANNNTMIRNIHIAQTGSLYNGGRLIKIGSGVDTGFSILENVTVENFTSSGFGSISDPIIDVQGNAYVNNVEIRNCPLNNDGVFEWNKTTPVDEGTSSFNNISVRNSGNGTSGAIKLDGENFVATNLIAISNGNHGIEVVSSRGKLQACYASSNSGDGINWTAVAAARGSAIQNCSSFSNGGWGILANNAVAGDIPTGKDNAAKFNSTGQITFSAPWAVTDNET